MIKKHSWFLSTGITNTLSVNIMNKYVILYLGNVINAPVLYKPEESTATVPKD